MEWFVMQVITIQLTAAGPAEFLIIFLWFFSGKRISAANLLKRGCCTN
jgi:hypothetical protein